MKFELKQKVFRLAHYMDVHVSVIYGFFSKNGWMEPIFFKIVFTIPELTVSRVRDKYRFT